MIYRKTSRSFFLVFVILLCGCGQKSDTESNNSESMENFSENTIVNRSKPKVTFVELGSDKCIPCKMMQPVMEAIEEEFGDQIKVVFYDVWKDPAPGRKYGIRVIPTQVFLNESGEEFFRHQGFFPKEDIEKLLVENGLKKLKHVDIEN